MYEVSVHFPDKPDDEAHSSASRGQVAASTLKNAWNWCGPAKAIDYGTGGESVPETSETPRYGTVVASPSLRMRKTPGTNGEYMLKVPESTRLLFTQTRVVEAKLWGLTSYNGYDGWVQVTEYVRMEQES